jgi:hypothetical protein
VLDLFHVVSAVHHGCAGVGGVEDSLEDLLPRLRIDVDGQFVEQ